MPEQKTLGGEFDPDPARYRKASEPHESMAAAEESLAAFHEELAELRTKHHIKDLYVVYNVAVFEENGTETVHTAVNGYGDQSRWEAMAATAYGFEKASHDRAIRQMLAGKTE